MILLRQKTFIVEPSRENSDDTPPEKRTSVFNLCLIEMAEMSLVEQEAEEAEEMEDDDDDEEEEPPPSEVVRNRWGHRMCPDNHKKRSRHCSCAKCKGKPQVRRMCPDNPKKRSYDCPCAKCKGKPRVQVYRMCDKHPDQRAHHCGPCGKRKCPCGSNADKARCVPCKGSGVCECGRERNTCKKCDPQGHLVHLLRSRLHYARKARGDTKTQRTMDIVGCTPAFLCDKLGELCDFYNATNKYPGFVFDNKEINYEIDHFLPLLPPVRLAKEEFTRRSHWTNCRPMPAKDNKSKGNRIEEGPSPEQEREMIRKLNECLNVS